MRDWNLDVGSGWITNASQALSPNHDQRPPDTEIDVLVIHAISLPPNQFGDDYIIRFFTNCLDYNIHPYFKEIEALRVSAHFLIDRNGHLTQFVSTQDRAWHAGLSSFQGRQQVNDFSIGIELEGCDEWPFEDKQYESLAHLVSIIKRSYPDISDQNIVGHSDISPGRKTDPGPCFDWPRFRSLL